MKPGSSKDRVVLENVYEVWNLQDAVSYYGENNTAILEQCGGFEQHLEKSVAPLELSEDESELALSALKYARDNIPADGIRQHIVDMLDDYESARASE